MSHFADTAHSIDEWTREYQAEIKTLGITYKAFQDLEQGEDLSEEQTKAMNEAGYPEGTDAEDWLHEVVDGHEWVIYTWKARCVAVASDQDTAELCLEIGIEGIPTPEQVAFLCIEADVRDSA